MRGSKTPPEVKEKVLASLTVTDNAEKTARETGVPITTVKDIRRKAQEKDDGFDEARRKQREEIIQRMWNIAAKGTKLMERKMDMISDDESGEALAATDMREISTPTATMIDKARLMEGQTTENIGVDLLKFEDF